MEDEIWAKNAQIGLFGEDLGPAIILDAREAIGHKCCEGNVSHLYCVGHWAFIVVPISGHSCLDSEVIYSLMYHWTPLQGALRVHTRIIILCAICRSIRHSREVFPTVERPFPNPY